MKHDLELFDILAQREGPECMMLAKHLVEQLIVSFRRLEELDQFMDEVSIDTEDRPAANAMRNLLGEWADHAEAVIQRVAKLPFRIDFKTLVASLEHSVGRTRARLACSLDDIAEGERQTDPADLVTIAEVRDELRARAHT